MSFRHAVRYLRPRPELVPEEVQPGRPVILLAFRNKAAQISDGIQLSAVFSAKRSWF